MQGEVMRHRLVLAALALSVSGCAGSPAASPTGTASSEPSPVPTDSDVPSPSAEPSAAAGPIYPFVLAWPADSVIGEWRYATAPWNGESRVDSGNQYTDFLLTHEGRLFAVGVPTDEGAPELRDLIAGQAAGWHGCEREPNVEEALSGGGAEGIYGEYTCGRSTVARWVGVHEGFGLFVGLIVTGDLADDVAEAFKRQITDLDWTN
jgi:hypothetical protein